ncbi:MAG TPA: proton-conducting transporter membrane subunit [Herpetosiphonaceae bacterium]
MTYLLLMLFPLAIAGGSFVLRRQSQLVGWAGAATVAAELWLALSAPIDQPAQLLGVSINYNELGQLFLATFCLSALITMLAATFVAHGEHFVAMLLLILSLGAAILIIQEPLLVAALLLLASLIGGVQLIDQPLHSPTLLRPQTLGMAVKYTLLVALGGLLLLIGFILATAYTQQLATTGPTLTRAIFGVLVAGFCIRLGLIPFHLWLPDMLDEAPPTTMFVHVGLLTIFALPVLLVALQTQPQLIVGNTGGQRLLLGLGGLSALFGSALALGAARVRRVIAFLTIANAGLLTIGLGMTTTLGVSAALIGALNHVLAVALLTLGLALLEQPVPGRREQAGALRERPLAAVAFLLGVLLLLGVPPFSGFLPKLLLIAASQERGWPLALIVAISLVLSGAAGAKLLRRVLLQPRDLPTTRSLLSDDIERLTTVGVPYAPRALLALILALLLGSVVVGLWPQPIVARLDATVRALAFLSQ